MFAHLWIEVMRKSLLILIVMLGSCGADYLSIWQISQVRSPFEGFAVLERKGEIAPTYRNWHFGHSDTIDCSLLLLTTVVAIEYPKTRFLAGERPESSQQDVAFRMSGKQKGRDRVCVVPEVFTETKNGRNIILIPANFSKRILRDIQSNRYHTLSVYLGSFPREMPKDPRAFIKNLVDWTFKFDITGGRSAIRELVKNTP